MLAVEVENGTTPEITPEMVQAQLELLVRDEVFRSSKRSVAFLRYVVEQTLAGQTEQIKERSIGVEVFGRDPAYDTNSDHIVRTAATELRKRLATYYIDPRHQAELRVALLPGSYIPRFTLPHGPARDESESKAEAKVEEMPLPALPAGPATLTIEALSPAVAEPASAGHRRRWIWVAAAAAVLLLAGAIGAVYGLSHKDDAQALFWKPVLSTPGPILLAVGDHPNGPPSLPNSPADDSLPTPVPHAGSAETVPFADTVTIARVTGVLAEHHKQVLIRRGNASSFTDLRQGASVLVGAFNNEWSLRLTRQMRFSLAMDADKHLIYIRDSQNPTSREWSWATNQSSIPMTGANSPRIRDYALISRIRDSETGHVVVVIGGLYTYGTQAAGEFLSDPVFLQSIARQAQLGQPDRNLQIVLGTTVTDGTPGPPRVLAVSAE